MARKKFSTASGTSHLQVVFEVVASQCPYSIERLMPVHDRSSLLHRVKMG